MNISRVHICTGGRLDVFPVRKENELIIGVDGGALALLDRGITFDLAVGDFDTIGDIGVERIREAGVRLESYSAEKDATDTEIALDLAFSYHPEEIVIYGALGSRMDHTLANLQLLIKGHQAGIWTVIRGYHNEICLLSDRFPSCKVNRGPFAYVSLLPLSMQVTGVTLSDFLYPLDNHTLELGSTLGMSNQLCKESGAISIKSGFLYVLQARDVPRSAAHDS